MSYKHTSLAASLKNHNKRYTKRAVNSKERATIAWCLPNCVQKYKLYKLYDIKL